MVYFHTRIFCSSYKIFQLYPDLKGLQEKSPNDKEVEENQSDNDVDGTDDAEIVKVINLFILFLFFKLFNQFVLEMIAQSTKKN